MLKQRRLKNSKKKTSKFEREVESNGNTLLAQAFFLFSRGFLINIQKDSLFVMVSPVTTCRPINAKKKTSTFEGSAQSHEELERAGVYVHGCPGTGNDVNLGH